MNKTQRKILTGVIFVVIGMFLFPPFTAPGGYNAGYRFIFGYGGPHVNSFLLLTQWIGVLIVGTIAFFMAKEE